MIKINAQKELGARKNFEVKESNKNIRATWKMQKEMAHVQILQQEAQTAEGQDFEGLIDSMLELQDSIISYVVNILNLDEKLADKVDEMKFDDTVEFATRISSALLHIEATEATKEDTGLEA